MKNAFLIMAMLVSAQVFAADRVAHELIRRVVVFPFKTETHLSKVSEEAWWRTREMLTGNKRFLVASRDFLIKKDVLQPRGTLKPADAVILGRLLDSHVMITTFIKGKSLHMVAYESDYGQVVWQHEIRMHPSVPLERQILAASEKLVNDFVASVPYQGFVVVDNLVGRPYYQIEDRVLIHIDIGLNSQATVGDDIQLIRIFRKNFKPLFEDGATIEVFAEGRILSIDRTRAKVEILRVTALADIQEASLVRLPKELKRLQDSFAIKERVEKNVTSDYFSLEMKPTKADEAEKKPLLAALSFLANLATFLILAF